MASFTDLTGTVWSVRFSIPFQRTVRKRTGISIVRLLAEDTLRQLAEDEEKTYQLIWACYQDQAADRDLTEDQFFGEDRTDADTMEAAIDAIFDAALESLPKQKKTAAAKVLRILRGSGRSMTNKAMAAIDQLDESKIIQEIEAAIDNQFNLLPKTKKAETKTKRKSSRPKSD